MIKLVLLRHGESVWNRENRFTGWTDVDLTDAGIAESHEAAAVLLREKYTFDFAFTSVLKRAIKSLWIVLEDMNLMWIPIHPTLRLNERHYGALQGLNKAETAKKYGLEKVHIWRRGYSTRPPPLDEEKRRQEMNDHRYSSLLPGDFPRSESLKDTERRVTPIWHDTITPMLEARRKVIVVAHGSSLRALVKHLDSVSDEEIMNLNIPTGIPLVYELDDQTHKPLDHYYLGDAEKIALATQAVANQLLGNSERPFTYRQED